jgi:hypothetical protein
MEAMPLEVAYLDASFLTGDAPSSCFAMSLT